MDLAAVFGLSLLGGYFFAHYWKLTAFATRRADQHLYFRAAYFGAILFTIALVIRHELLLWPRYVSFDAAFLEYVKPALKEENGIFAGEIRSRAEWLVTAVYSMVLGPIGAFVLNRFTPRDWALQRSVGLFDRLLLRAQRSEMPISLTLASGKVYIGAVSSTTDLDSIPPVIAIVPVFSGYRSPDGRMVLTTDYESVYADLEKGGAAQLELPADWITQFGMTIRTDMIVSANLFSPAVYTRFNPTWREQLIKRRYSERSP